MDQQTAQKKFEDRIRQKEDREKKRLEDLVTQTRRQTIMGMLNYYKPILEKKNNKIKKLKKKIKELKGELKGE